MHVLLIEPDVKLAGIYKAALTDAGHTVETVSQAQAAVHKADLQRPDIVLLELQLARHNGLEFMYEFRSYPEWQTIPVIVLTMVPPSSLQLDEAAQQKLGIQRVLYKPATNLRRLIAAVEGL